MRKGLGGPVLGLLIGTLLVFHFHLFGRAAAVHDAGKVVAYAEQQLGKPYLWGGTGPDAFDCSGLVMMAYRQVGVTFGSSRPTVADEWHYGPQTSRPRRGDLVFFAGADGTAADPGHVGIYLAPHWMIDAYRNGTVIRREKFGVPDAAGGLQDVVGYTDP